MPKPDWMEKDTENPVSNEMAPRMVAKKPKIKSRLKGIYLPEKMFNEYQRILCEQKIKNVTARQIGEEAIAYVIDKYGDT